MLDDSLILEYTLNLRTLSLKLAIIKIILERKENFGISKFRTFN